MESYLYSTYTPTQGEQGHISICTSCLYQQIQSLCLETSVSYVYLPTLMWTERWNDWRTCTSNSRELCSGSSMCLFIAPQSYAVTLMLQLTVSLSALLRQTARSDSRLWSSYAQQQFSFRTEAEFCFTDTGNSVQQPRSLKVSSRSVTQIPRNVRKPNTHYRINNSSLYSHSTWSNSRLHNLFVYCLFQYHHPSKSSSTSFLSSFLAIYFCVKRRKNLSVSMPYRHIEEQSYSFSHL